METRMRWKDGQAACGGIRIRCDDAEVAHNDKHTPLPRWLDPVKGRPSAARLGVNKAKTVDGTTPLQMAAEEGREAAAGRG